MSTNAGSAVEVVEQQVARWAVSYGELRQSFTDLLGDAGEYLCQQDMPVVRGAAGTLTHWRDYWDMRPLLALQTAA